MNRQKPPFSQRLRNALLLILFLPFVLPLALVAVVLYLLYRITLYLLVWTFWLPRGKDILFVYSDSPIWHDYMAEALKNEPPKDFPDAPHNKFPLVLKPFFSRYFSRSHRLNAGKRNIGLRIFLLIAHQEKSEHIRGPLWSEEERKT